MGVMETAASFVREVARNIGDMFLVTLEGVSPNEPSRRVQVRNFFLIVVPSALWLTAFFGYIYNVVL